MALEYYSIREYIYGEFIKLYYTIGDMLCLLLGDAQAINDTLDMIGDVGAFTLEEIGQVLGVSRERIRQIEQAALNKLKHPRVGRRLQAYLATVVIDESQNNYGYRSH